MFGLFKRLLIFPALLPLMGFGFTPPLSQPMIGHQSILPPFGLVELCKRNPVQCHIHTSAEFVPALTPELWFLMDNINRKVNAAIEQKEDIDIFGIEEFWTMPVRQGNRIVGDCEDISLDKRRLLIQAGVPDSSVLFAVARLPEGTLHTILVVQTDHGDYVLDNLDNEIKPWLEKQGYHWVARQDNQSMLHWISL